MGDNREQLGAGTFKRLTGEVREAGWLSPATEMLEIAQRRGMIYEQHWVPQQIARLELTAEEPTR